MNLFIWYENELIFIPLIDHKCLFAAHTTF
jgi:hypothetical protein